MRFPLSILLLAGGLSTLVGETERWESPAPSYNEPLSAALASESQWRGFLEGGRVLEEIATPADARGAFSKVKMIETKGTQRLIRLEERWERDAAGKNVLRETLTMSGAHLLAFSRLPQASRSITQVVDRFQGAILKSSPLAKGMLHVIRTRSGSLLDYTELLDKLRGTGQFDFVEPDYLIRAAAAATDDPLMSSAWGLENFGQTGGKTDADIDATVAWKRSKGDRGTVVALLDTGVDANHPDLRASIWSNPREIAGNGLDDDGNGYIDDVQGWDFYDSDADPADVHGHGTHNAGIIAAESGNGIGLSGVAPNVSLMSLRILGPDGVGLVSDAVAALAYAASMKVKVTSSSWTTNGPSRALESAFAEAGASDIMNVVAVGNEGLDLRKQSRFPASYPEPSLIRVAASGHTDGLAGFSNFGVNVADLASPGVSIFSTLPSGQFGYASGTSSATAYVAGAAALLRSSRAALLQDEAKTVLLSGAEELTGLLNKVTGGVRLNLGGMMAASDEPLASLSARLARRATQSQGSVQSLPPAGDYLGTLLTGPSPKEDKPALLERPESSWQGTYNNPERTNFVPENLGGSTLPLNWILPGISTNGSLPIGHGATYLVSYEQNSSYLNAIDLGAGVARWRAQLERSYYYSEPIYHKGKVLVYVSNYPGKLYCFNAENGGLEWSVIGYYGSYSAGGLTAVGDTVSLNSQSEIKRFHLATGAELAPLNAASGLPNPTYIGESVLSLYRGLVTLYSALGEASHQLDGYWSEYEGASGSWDGSRIFFANRHGLHALAINGLTFTPLWQETASYVGTPAVAGGLVYAMRPWDKSVVAFDGTTGQIRQTFAISKPPRQIVVTGDSLIVAAYEDYSSSNGVVEIWGLASGKLLQTIPKSVVFSFADNTLLIAGGDYSSSYISAFRIQGGNHPPVPTTSSAAGTEDLNLTITLQGTDEDGDTLQAFVTSLPNSGALFQTPDGVTLGAEIIAAPVRVSNAQRKVIYRPVANAFGAVASFGYRLSDGKIRSSDSIVYINLAPLDDPPVALDDEYVIRGGEHIPSFLPTNNDSDLDGDILSIVAFTQGTKGIVSQNADGSLRFQSNVGFTTGTDSFSYTMRDTGGTQRTATVRVRVDDQVGRAWPTFGGSARHEGFHARDLGNVPLHERWDWQAPSNLLPVTVADGRVYAAYWNSYYSAEPSKGIVALDVANGIPVWRREDLAQPTAGTTYDAGAIYFASSSGPNKLRASDGVSLWTGSTNLGSFFIAPAVSSSGAYFHAYSSFYGFDPATGTQLFQYYIGDCYGWAPAIDGSALYTFMAGKLRSHNPLTGELAWDLDLGWNDSGRNMDRTLAIQGGRAYLVNNSLGGNELICVDLVSHAVVWRVRGAFTGTPAVANGLVYAAAGERILAYRLGGQFLAEFTMPSGKPARGELIATKDYLVAYSPSTSSVPASSFLFRLSDRQLAQTITPGGPGAVAEGVLYLTCSDNHVRAYGQPLPANGSPTATPVSFTGDEDTDLLVSLQGTDPENSPLSYFIETLPTQGQLFQKQDNGRGVQITNVPLKVSAANQVIYVPETNANGQGIASFAFKVHDGLKASSAAEVTLSVTAQNDAPVANNDSLLTAINVPVEFGPLINDRDVDGDNLAIVRFTQPNSGQLSSPQAERLRYVPNAGFTGTDSFTYTIRDAVGLEVTATVTILVGALGGADWPTYDRDASRSGFQPVLLGSNLQERWRVPVSGSYGIANGRLYLSHAYSPQLLCLDSRSGAEYWRVAFPGGIGTPVARSNEVCLMSGGTAYSISRNSGLSLWSNKLSDYYGGGPLLDGGAYLYYLGDRIGINASTGVAVFTNAAYYYYDRDSLVVDGGLYTITGDEIQYISKASGQVLASARIPDLSNSRGLARGAGGRIVLVAGGKLLCIRLSDFTVLWRTTLPQYSSLLCLSQSAAYLRTSLGIQAYETSAGSLISVFNHPNNDQEVAGAIVTYDSLITTSYNKTYIHDLSTQAIKQTIPNGGTLAVADDSLFIALSNGGGLLAFGQPSPSNQAPTANAQIVQGTEDTPLTINLSGQDFNGDPLSYIITTLPGLGTLHQTTDGTTRGSPIVNLPAAIAGQRVIYVPSPEDNGDGLVDFSFKVRDGKATSSAATVTVNIAAVNDAPIAVADIINLGSSAPWPSFRPQANDRDPERGPLSVSSFTQGARGLVVRLGDGSFRYIPNSGFTNGSDTFTYVVQDQEGLSGTGTVTVQVGATGALLGRDWPAKGNGPSRSGFQPVWLHGKPFEPRFTQNYSQEIRSIASHDGDLYAAEASSSGSYYSPPVYPGSIMRLNGISGGEAWNIDKGGIDIAQYGQRLYYSTPFLVGSIQLSDGSLGWNTVINSSAPIAVDATGLFVNTGRLRGFEINNGFEFTPNDSGYYSSNSLPVTLYQGGLYSVQEGYFVSLNRVSRATIWSLPLGQGSSGASVVCGYDRAVMNSNGELICVNLATRTIAWRVRGQHYHMPAVAHQAVYAATGSSIRAYDIETGAFIASYGVIGETGMTTQPILTCDSIIAVTSERTHVFDLLTRSLLQTIDYGGEAILAGDALYFRNGNAVRAFQLSKPSNQAPSATASTVTTFEDTRVMFNLAGADPEGSGLVFTVTRPPARGRLFHAATGKEIKRFPKFLPSPPSLDYEPPANAFGEGLGSLAFTVHDGEKLSPEAVVKVNVTPVNDLPIAQDDFRPVAKGEIVSPIRVLSNDVDPDNLPLSIVSFSQPSIGGLVESNGDGTLRYTAPANVPSGEAIFSYEIQDAEGARSSATVRVTISDVGRDAWPMFGGGPEHSGSVASSFGREPWAELWKLNLQNSGFSQSAIAEGKVFTSYYTTNNYNFTAPHVVALDQMTGEQLWRRTFTDYTSVFAPAYRDGKIFFGRGSAIGSYYSSSHVRFTALDASSGAVRWNNSYQSIIGSALSLTPTDLGVFAPSSAKLFRLNKDSGAEIYSRDLTGASSWSPALASGSIYTFNRGIFSAYEALTGSLEWTRDVIWNESYYYGDSPERGIAIQGRSAYVITNRASVQALVCLDLDARTIRWQVEGVFQGTPAVRADAIYALSGNTVAEYSPLGVFIGRMTGSSDSFQGQPVIADDLVLAANAQTTYAFSRETRETVQTLPTGGRLSLTPDVLITAGYQGITAYAPPSLVSFSPSTGSFALPFEVTLGSPHADARICYTLDGSTPNLTSPQVNVGQKIRLDQSTIVKAMMVRGNYVSSVSEASYTVVDTDGDKVPDWWETLCFGGIAPSNGKTDRDGDGMSDAAEFQAGTDPNNPKDLLDMLQPAEQLVQGDEMVIMWPSKTDRLYVVEKSANMANWTAITGLLPGTGNPMIHRLNIASLARQFIQVRALPKAN